MYSRKTTTVIDKSVINLFITAISAAKKAGDAIMKIYESGYEIEYIEYDDNSPLTIADRQSHEVIQRCLKNSGTENYFPVLSEEGKDVSYEERKEWEYFWLVDPLDGTKEFIKRNGEFTVNIALMHKNRPVLGVIYVPAKEIFYFAVKGLGAYKLNNGKLLNNSRMVKSLNKFLDNSTKLPSRHLTRPQSRSHTSKLTIIGSRSHATVGLETFVEEMKKQYEEVEFISAGSSLKFCLVAEGKAAIYPRFGTTMEWDTAAGQCIVEQSGGRVLSIKNKKPLLYNKRNLKNTFFVCEGKYSRVFPN